MSRSLLVIGAHSADFVWRAGGVVAVTTARGGTARVLALSYGERGESGELWKEPGQTVERVKEVRHGEAERAARALGAEFECLDLGDYPLEIDKAGLVALAERTVSRFCSAAFEASVPVPTDGRSGSIVSGAEATTIRAVEPTSRAAR